MGSFLRRVADWCVPASAMDWGKLTTHWAFRGYTIRSVQVVDADQLVDGIIGPWVVDSNDARLLPNEHRAGVPWWKSPLPPENHSCEPQTRGWVGDRRIHRCACGATRHPLLDRDMPDLWIHRNERRRGA